MKPRGKTKEIVLNVNEIDTLIQKAIAVIDTKDQYEIRRFLEEASRKCLEIRNQFDPM